MRTALFALIGAALVATTPVVARAQAPVDSRPGGVSRDRDASGRTRDRDGRWDWERGRDDRNDRNDRDRRDARNDRRGYGHDDWKVYEREQRDFDRRTHRWSSRQWNAYRTCERDLWRRSRWDRNDSRREALSERRRIRDYCERRVNRW